MNGTGSGHAADGNARPKIAPRRAAPAASISIGVGWISVSIDILARQSPQPNWYDHSGQNSVSFRWIGIGSKGYHRFASMIRFLSHSWFLRLMRRRSSGFANARSVGTEARMPILMRRLTPAAEDLLRKMEAARPLQIR